MPVGRLSCRDVNSAPSVGESSSTVAPSVRPAVQVQPGHQRIGQRRPAGDRVTRRQRGPAGATSTTWWRSAIFGELKVPVVRQHAGYLETLFDEVNLWGHALRQVRAEQVAAA